jgi:thioredoxin 1
MSMAEIGSVNEKSFQEEVIDSDKPVLVDFWAAWCGYCSRLSPVIEELAADMGDKVKFVKVNVDENRSLAQKHDVTGLPTMILFKNGQAVEKLTGFMPKANIAAKINPQL